MGCVAVIHALPIGKKQGLFKPKTSHHRWNRRSQQMNNINGANHAPNNNTNVNPAGHIVGPNNNANRNTNNANGNHGNNTPL